MATPISGTAAGGGTAHDGDEEEERREGGLVEDAALTMLVGTIDFLEVYLGEEGVDKLPQILESLRTRAEGKRANGRSSHSLHSISPPTNDRATQLRTGAIEDRQGKKRRRIETDDASNRDSGDDSYTYSGHVGSASGLTRNEKSRALGASGSARLESDSHAEYPSRRSEKPERAEPAVIDLTGDEPSEPDIDDDTEADPRGRGRKQGDGTIPERFALSDKGFQSGRGFFSFSSSQFMKRTDAGDLGKGWADSGGIGRAPDYSRLEQKDEAVIKEEQKLNSKRREGSTLASPGTTTIQSED